MRSVSVPRAHLSIVVFASVAACGFDPQPKSGVVACKPGGAACCPEGYICVGRGAVTAAGPSPGACWNRDDLPMPALAATHDYTPTVAYDPVCLVTDWLPPGTGGTSGTLDAGWLDGVDANPGADAPLGQDGAADSPVGSGGTGGGDTATGGAIGADGGGDSTGHDAGELDLPIAGSGDAAVDLPRGDAPGTSDTYGTAVADAGPDSPVAGDAPPDLSPGDPAGGLDSGPPKSITSITAGDKHTCAVVNGGVKCWGNNDFDQLGDGTNSESLSPVQVVGLESGVTAIASSYEHTCAVANGGLKCWGWNPSGQLGDGTEGYTRVPVQPIGLETGVTAVATGQFHTCAVVNGGLSCWGDNVYGQIAGDTLSVRMVPSPVPGLESGVTAVACGYNHTCAVVNGETLCWGHNEHGQIGNDTTVDARAPTHVVGLSASSGVSAISGGANHTCALAAGSVRCWGDNSAAQLGDGTRTSQLSCVEGNELLAGVTALSAGGLHNCALASSVAQCWGYDSAYAAGGGGTPLYRLTPGPVVGLGTGVTAISAGGSHSCAVVANQMFCWGENDWGQLGDGSKTWQSVPVPVRGL